MSYFLYQEKRVFYEEAGSGPPLLLLHGDTASGRMFEPLLPLYTPQFRVVLMDFLGNGRSDRVDAFPTELWYDEALQACALIEHLACGSVHLLGTSGGAWAALNAALERPELVGRVVADSFDGRTLPEGFARALIAERTAAAQNPFARQFYEWCQGPGWERVVEQNTDALVRCARQSPPLFHRPLSSLRPAVLFLGSREDGMVRGDMEAEYREMCRLVPRGSIHLLSAGAHPALLSNAEAASQAVGSFLLRPEDGLRSQP